MNINQIPQILKDYISATNKPDPEAYLKCFSENAVVFDEGKKRYGKEAIKKWSNDYQFAVNVKLEPKNCKQSANQYILTCKVDGDYDKTGLPDPLLLDFEFHIENDIIVELSIY